MEEIKQLKSCSKAFDRIFDILEKESLDIPNYLSEDIGLCFLLHSNRNEE